MKPLARLLATVGSCGEGGTPRGVTRDARASGPSNYTPASGTKSIESASIKHCASTRVKPLASHNFSFA